ncbi:MAG: trypsin-like peptidase domain-containing protein [Ignavibacteriales bacterium]|nr:trypsin-like peptidase domain-containing protein [Ignavibacteriales bacterium]
MKPTAAIPPTVYEATANLPSVVTAQDRQTGDNQEAVAKSRRSAITQAVGRVSPAVVGINVMQIQQLQYRNPFSDWFGDDPVFRRFWGDRTYKQKVQGLGSGFIISSDGYIVTNDHVAGNATEITVTLTGGKQYKGKIIGTDHSTDICLIKVDAKDLPYIPMGNSDDLMSGEWAIALGNPFGLFQINDKPTVTVGVISSLGMNLGNLDGRYYRDMIETDAAINGGNSGGPLVNSDGEVIGMNTLIFTGGESRTYVGYGFAIPVNKVKKVVAELKKKGKVTRDVSAGFEYQEVDGRIARYLGLAQIQGIIISEIEPRGPAEKAGLKIGDVILEINGQKVNNEQDFIGVLVDSSPGDILNVKVFRERRLIEAALKLEKS